MSSVNAVTIYAENLTSPNVVVGNTSTNIKISANSLSVSVGNGVVINTSSILVTNTSAPIYNTAINSTSISATRIFLNGIEYDSIAPTTPMVDYQVFTANGSWTKPSWATANDIVTVQMWGGGGSGMVNAAGSSFPGVGCGGGGACAIYTILANQCNSVCDVVVGPGGNSVALNVVGNPGGNSSFNAGGGLILYAYGGGAASGTNTAVAGVGQGGGGGGWFGPGVNATPSLPGAGGGPLGGNSTIFDSTFGGGGGANSAGTGVGGSSIYGGGGGARGAGVGGSSIYGGGGGGATPGVSIFGGNGGVSAANSGPSTAGWAPGGGGGANNSVGGLAGGRGEVRVWTTATSIGGDTTPRYFISANSVVVNEGESILFTVSTVNVEEGTTLYYTLNNSSTATSSDFSTAVNGSIVISQGSSQFTLTANTDGDASEAFWMDLRTSSSSGEIVANSASVTIQETSQEIQYIGLTSANATSVSLPSHQTGDLILIMAQDYEVNNDNAGELIPALPAGYTSIRAGTSNADEDWSWRVGYKFATNNSETSGTWTNAEKVVAAVYRNVVSIGTNTQTIVNTDNPTWPAMTLQKTDNTSWVVGLLAHEYIATATDVPFTTRFNQNHTTWWDTNGPVSSFSSVDAELNNDARGTTTIAIELKNS